MNCIFISRRPDRTQLNEIPSLTSTVKWCHNQSKLKATKTQTIKIIAIRSKIKDSKHPQKENNKGEYN